MFPWIDFIGVSMDKHVYQLLKLSSSGVASPKFWEGLNILTLSQQQYLDWYTTSRNTKQQNMLEVWGAWPLWPSWLRLCCHPPTFIMKNSKFAVGFREISKMDSAFIILQCFKLAHFCIQSAHEWRAWINQQIFNRKSILRNTTHRPTFCIVCII